MDLRYPPEELVLNASDITIANLCYEAISALRKAQASGKEQRREFPFAEKGVRVVVTFVATVSDDELILKFDSTALNARRLARRVGYRLEELLGRPYASLPLGFWWRLPHDFVLPKLPPAPDLIELKGEIYGELVFGAHLRLWLYDFASNPREPGSRDAYADTYVGVEGHVKCSALLTELSPTALDEAVRAQIGDSKRRVIGIRLCMSLDGMSVLATHIDIARFVANHNLLGHRWEDEGRTVLSSMVVR